MIIRCKSRPAGASIAQQPESAMTIGRLVHQLVAEAVSSGVHRASVEDLRDFVWTRTAELATSRTFGRAVRSARLAIAGHTTGYLRRFAPPASWSLLGAEYSMGSAGVADLVWVEADGRILLDELKFAGGIHVAVGDGPTRQQARRYATAARERWGDRSVGVRVVLLGAPRRSYLVHPDLRESPLLSTPFWFDARILSREVAPC